jgi:heme A synthase
VWWVLPAAAALITVLIMLALAGAALDDAQIDARPGHATAEVLAVTSIRTLVQFATPAGKVYRPDAGLAYPSGLQAGQLVRVDYDTSDPAVHVRVAGRTWVQGIAPASITVLAAWALVAPATWWLRRRHRHAV